MFTVHTECELLDTDMKVMLRKDAVSPGPRKGDDTHAFNVQLFSY